MANGKVTLNVLAERICNLKESVDKLADQFNKTTDVAYGAKYDIKQHLSNHKMVYVTFTVIMIIVEVLGKIIGR